VLFFDATCVVYALLVFFLENIIFKSILKLCQIYLNGLNNLSRCHEHRNKASLNIDKLPSMLSVRCFWRCGTILNAEDEEGDTEGGVVHITGDVVETGTP
jgi:hypothetical protein